MGALAGALTTNEPLTALPMDAWGRVVLGYDFTIFNGPGSGSLVFHMTGSGEGETFLDGCGLVPCDSSAEGWFGTGTSGAGIPVNGSLAGNIPLGNGTTEFDLVLPFIGTHASVSVFLDAIARCGGGWFGMDCTANANWYDTVSFRGVTILDDLDNEVLGATILSDSGFDPNNIPAPVPEPATLLLLGSGLAGLAGLRRRKRGGA